MTAAVILSAYEISPVKGSEKEKGYNEAERIGATLRKIKED